VLATVRTNYVTGDERQEQANGNFRPGDIRLHAWFFLLIKLGSILAAMYPHRQSQLFKGGRDLG
jgi:hypothetical protein